MHLFKEEDVYYFSDLKKYIEHFQQWRKDTLWDSKS